MCSDASMAFLQKEQKSAALARRLRGGRRILLLGDGVACNSGLAEACSARASGPLMGLIWWLWLQLMGLALLTRCFVRGAKLVEIVVDGIKCFINPEAWEVRCIATGQYLQRRCATDRLVPLWWDWDAVDGWMDDPTSARSCISQNLGFLPLVSCSCCLALCHPNSESPKSSESVLTLSLDHVRGPMHHGSQAGSLSCFDLIASMTRTT